MSDTIFPIIGYVYIWADGTWCEEEELAEMSFMSDDYIKAPVVALAAGGLLVQAPMQFMQAAQEINETYNGDQHDNIKH